MTLEKEMDAGIWRAEAELERLRAEAKPEEGRSLTEP